MKEEIIEEYVERILGNRLREFKIKEKFIIEIKQNVREQIYSLIFHWNDIDFRKAILITGIEEAKFYEPDADLDIKSFVVVAIRNSYIEKIFSIDCKSIELDEPIDEKEIKIVTKEAIQYFRNINFEELSNDIEKLDIKDKYGEIVGKYPMAWRALIELEKCIGKKRIYDEISVKERLTLKQFEIEEGIDSENKENKYIETQSGISKKFSKDLLEILEKIIESDRGVIVVDSFKMLTRNFEKLMMIIEILLENNSVFATSNYLITNSYIGKRANIYRAAHTDVEFFEKLKSEEFLVGLSKFHRTILKSYIDEI